VATPRAHSCQILPRSKVRLESGAAGSCGRSSSGLILAVPNPLTNYEASLEYFFDDA
jgi:hypothetical protein